MRHLVSTPSLVARMQSGIRPLPSPNPGLHPGYEVCA